MCLFNLLPVDFIRSTNCSWSSVAQDKSSEVRKAAEAFMNEVLKISGQEVVWLIHIFI
jgi:hypothetical protein